MTGFDADRSLVSIITPAYKAAAFVGETIQSVLAQRHLDWEMIVVDDCSPDSTAEVVEQYAAADRRVRLVRSPTNGGVGAARNAALDAATGRYIAFLDSDDLWLPEKLESQLEFMRDLNAGFSFTAFRRISQDGRRVGRLIIVPPRLDYAALLGNTAIVTSTVLIDRAVVGDFRMTKTYYDDFVLWLQLLKRGTVAHGLKRDLTRYRVVSQSISRDKANSARQVWRTYRQVERLGVGRSSWSFARYATRALLKYRRF